VTQYEEYLTQLRKKDGSSLNPSSLVSHRSALYHLYRHFNKQLPSAWDDSLKSYFKGAKRIAAQERGEGNGKMTEARKHFHSRCIHSWQSRCCKRARLIFTFGHAFMVLSWNLMCHAGNTETIRFSHMAWKSDALGIYFAHMKNDQEGARPRILDIFMQIQ